MYISAKLSIFFIVVAVVANIVSTATKNNHEVYEAFNYISYVADGLFLLSYIVLLVSIKMRFRSAVVSLIFLILGVVSVMVAVPLLLTLSNDALIASYVFLGLSAVCGVGFMISYIVLLVQHAKHS